MNGLSVRMYLTGAAAEAYEAKHGHKPQYAGGKPYLPLIGCWQPEDYAQFGDVTFTVQAKMLPTSKPLPTELPFDDPSLVSAQVTGDGLVTYLLECRCLPKAFFALGWVEEWHHWRDERVDARLFAYPLIFAELLWPDGRYEHRYVDVGGEAGVLDCIGEGSKAYTPALTPTGWQLMDLLCRPPAAPVGSILVTFGIYEGSGGPDSVVRRYGPGNGRMALFERADGQRYCFTKVDPGHVSEAGATPGFFQEGLGSMLMILGAKAARESEL